MNNWQAKGFATAIGAALLLVGIGGAFAQAPKGAPTVVVQAINQSSRITEHDSLTVSIEVASTANIQLVFFNFCRLTESVCYAPVIMSQQGSNWFVGTTKPMSSYRGMAVGVSAGYNITLQLTNNVNVTEPGLPNAFTNLTVAESVVPGYYYYKMTVANPLFALSGMVYDSTTGHALAGATVSLLPGSNTTTTSAAGAYSFSGLLNGSYTVSVSEHGYRSSSTTVAVAGSDAVADLRITNSTLPVSNHGTAGSKWWSSYSLDGVSPFIFVPAILVAVGLFAFFASRRMKGGRSSQEPGEAPTAPQPPSG
ncbi:MAG: carboxypeptidase-like regulatory domain-containing protein [Thermoplasmata archaeon]|nr:carboxypeptidase-like regulatory domain-containing protein [Thermoplasmata archaeon]MCI4359510.1 carboxypeptidase-like regulatory domain-containing protein [Thermoplasmata archaeon]